MKNNTQSRVYKSKPVGRSPPASSLSVSHSMKSNKSAGTKPELALSKLLRKKVTKNTTRGNPDFKFPKAKIAVFVDGCFWHRCPVHARNLPKTHRSYWRRKFERNMEKDWISRKNLRDSGWTVVRVWEHEIRSNPLAVAKRIRRLVSASSEGAQSL